MSVFIGHGDSDGDTIVGEVVTTVVGITVASVINNQGEGWSEGGGWGVRSTLTLMPPLTVSQETARTPRAARGAARRT